MLWIKIGMFIEVRIKPCPWTMGVEFPTVSLVNRDREQWGSGPRSCLQTAGGPWKPCWTDHFKQKTSKMMAAVILLSVQALFFKMGIFVLLQARIFCSLAASSSGLSFCRRASLWAHFSSFSETSPSPSGSWVWFERGLISAGSSLSRRSRPLRPIRSESTWSAVAAVYIEKVFWMFKSCVFFLWNYVVFHQRIWEIHYISIYFAFSQQSLNFLQSC